MDLPSKSRFDVKLFLGCKLNSELRMYLNQSPSWKQVSILPLAEKAENNHLIEVHYQAKDYLGRYLSDEKMTLSDLKNSAIQLKETIRVYCPQYDFDLLKICIFPQLFIA